MPPRPMSAPVRDTTSWRPSLPISGSAASGGAADDASAEPQWDPANPLPSTRTHKGREQFLQTPAYVIAAHYKREQSLQVKAHEEDLSEQLRGGIRHQNYIARERQGYNDEVYHAGLMMENLEMENRELKLKNSQLIEKMKAMERYAQDRKSSAHLMDGNYEGTKTRAQRDKVKWLEEELEKSQNHVMKLRMRLRMAGLPDR